MVLSAIAAHENPHQRASFVCSFRTLEAVQSFASLVINLKIRIHFLHPEQCMIGRQGEDVSFGFNVIVWVCFGRLLH
jgi:hypothetical protein